MPNREYLPGDARQRERAYSPAVKVKNGTTIYLAGHAEKPIQVILMPRFV
jgi:hypothetical protein